MPTAFANICLAKSARMQANVTLPQTCQMLSLIAGRSSLWQISDFSGGRLGAVGFLGGLPLKDALESCRPKLECLPFFVQVGKLIINLMQTRLGMSNDKFSDQVALGHWQSR